MSLPLLRYKRRMRTISQHCASTLDRGRRLIKRMLRLAGYDIGRYDPRLDIARVDPAGHYLVKRRALLDLYKIDLVLDVGANTGQYGELLRAIGYKGRIVSFEPLRAEYEKLNRIASDDGGWIAFNYALGDRDGTATINIAGNSYSSSLLHMLPTHLRSAPESKYVGSEEIRIRRLDDVFGDVCPKNSNVYLKIDTQGFEKPVLDGAVASLTHIDTIQIEMSLVPLYENQLLFIDLFRFLVDKGYRPVQFEPGFADEATQHLLQMDGIFRRVRAPNP